MIVCYQIRAPVNGYYPFREPAPTFLALRSEGILRCPLCPCTSIWFPARPSPFRLFTHFRHRPLIDEETPQAPLLLGIFNPRIRDSSPLTREDVFLLAFSPLEGSPPRRWTLDHCGAEEATRLFRVLWVKGVIRLISPCHLLKTQPPPPPRRGLHFHLFI